MTVKTYYEDDDSGEVHQSAAEVDAMWKIDRVRIVFECPVCGTEREHVSSSEPKKDETTFCNTCKEQYHLRPLRIPQVEVEDVGLQEEITYQLESIRRIHPLRDAHHQMINAMPASFKYMFFGSPPIIIQYVATYILFDAIRSSLFTDFFVTLAFGAVLATTFLASYSFYRSVARIVIGAVYIYYTEEVDCTFREYIYHAGNYAHIDPVGFKTR